MNDSNSSGITYTASCEFSNLQLLSVQIQIDGPFNDEILELAFPRWVPGSYFIREPIRFMQDILAIDSNGIEMSVERFSHNRIRIKLPKNVEKKNTIRIRYKLLCTQLSVRNNHLDKSHLHLMPPFTWMEVTKGIPENRINSNHKIILAHPPSWSSESQMPVVDFEIDPLTLEFIQEDLEVTKWVPEGRDEFLDGIIESNRNKAISFKVNGCVHKLKLWDAGNHEISENNVKKLVDKFKLIISEHYALFGIPEWKEYLTILHLTDGPRGGLEHLRSQTSMVPRLSLISDNVEEWRDLLSLFSHEFLHQWNVKRLRPVEFLDYDLNEEVHTDLLWWFEGLTSWLGDVLCWRSGAWSDEDWIADMKRKLERHFTGNGNQHQCLSMASFEAWIHLYRPHSHSRESQISYYLEGELALFCIDAEFRKITNGVFGLDDVMVLLWKKHGIDNAEGENQGLDWERLCEGLRELGGEQMVNFVDTLVNKKMRPPIEDAAEIYGVKVVSDKKDKTKNLGWLGLVFMNNSLKIKNFQTNSPCRNIMKTGDEIIAIDGLRVSNNNSLKKILTGRANSTIKITISSHGKLSDVDVNVGLKPEYPTLFKGEGNDLWKQMKKSRL
tara:strand:+ start:2563 stop:4395 length:1833 start_codon:yes stop_codon:yes gene_type:complete